MHLLELLVVGGTALLAAFVSSVSAAGLSAVLLPWPSETILNG